MTEIDVVDLKTLRQKYLKKKLVLDNFQDSVWVEYHKPTQEVFLEFNHLVKWSGDEYTYTVSLDVDEKMTIKKISALKCQRLAGDDAFRSSYRGKRCDEYDYYRLDLVLSKAVSDSQ